MPKRARTQTSTLKGRSKKVLRSNSNNDTTNEQEININSADVLHGQDNEPILAATSTSSIFHDKSFEFQQTTINDKSNGIILQDGNKENVSNVSIHRETSIQTKAQDKEQDASDEDEDLQDHYEEFDDEESNMLNLVFPSQREIEPTTVQLDVPYHSQFLMSTNCSVDSSTTDNRCSLTNNESQRLSPAALELWEHLEKITSIDEFEKTISSDHEEEETDGDQRSTRLFNGTIFH